MNLLFVTGELSLLKSASGLGRLVAALGGALCTLGHKVTAVVPLRDEGVIDRFSFARRLSPLTVEVPKRSVEVNVFDGRLPSGIDVKLLDNAELFQGHAAVTDDDDEPLRHAVLAKAALQLAASETSHAGGWHALHAFGLPAALAPYLASTAEDLPCIKRVLTVEHLGAQGRCDRSWVDDLGLPWDDFTPEKLEFYGELNMLKAGLVYADRLIMSGAAAVSDGCTPEGGAGLEGVMSERRGVTITLPPGLDYARWNPATDVNLSVHYDAEQRSGKVSCKAYLQNRLELPVRPDVPLVALAQPLTDLAEPLGRVLDQLMRADIQLVAAKGQEPSLAAAIEEVRGRWPRRIAELELTDVTWHHMLAGADLLVLDAPTGSDAETLLAAQRYGALPVARNEGLARDLIVDLTNTLDSGSGFLVHDDSPTELLSVARRAIASLLYGQPYHDALSRIMSTTCSWEDRARRLEQLYTELLGGDEPSEDDGSDS